MEPRKEQQNDNAQIEKTVLIIFSFYCINTIYCLIISGWNIVFPIFVLATLIGIWVLNIRHFFSFEKRAIVSTIAIMLCTFLFALCSTSQNDAFSVLYIMITLVALYGVIKCMYFSATISIVMVLVLAIFGNKICAINISLMELYHEMINLVVIHICLLLWLNGRKKSISRTVQTIQALKKAERIKDDFLANVSHELRTPLNTISGMSDIIQNEKNIDEIHKDCYYIQLASRTLMGTVSDIIDFSELQSGNVILENESYNIGTTINDIINMYNAKNNKSSIEFIVDLDVNMPKVLEGDEKKIRRIIMNFLGNAMKFTKDGCICLMIGGRKEGYGWNLQVKIVDTGIGIEEKNIERLFSTYGQVDTSRSRNAEGIGLGLAISKALVEKMNGTIMVQSRFGKGSTFQFVVPQKIVDEKPIITIENKHSLNVLTYLNREHFNLVEIRDAYIENLRRMIEKVRVKNHACRNLSEFKRRYATETYTHALITYDEYVEDRDYFNKISKEITVMVVLSHQYSNQITEESIVKIYKPFYAIPIINILNDSQVKNKRHYEDAFVAPTAHVLVVDDNQMNLNVIAGLLNKYEIKTTKAQSGDEAIKLIETMDYDFVFMDHMMPEKDGIETFKEIRQKRGLYFQNVPIIALTANAVAGSKEKFIQAGFSDFIEKPVELSVLEKVIKRTLPKEKLKFIERKVEDIIIDSIDIIPKPNPISKEPEIILEETTEESNAFTIGDLNVKNGIMYCGDEEKLVSILKDFCESSSEVKQGIIEKYDSKDWKNYKINVHALKSSMKSIGADKLSEMAKELEMLSGEGKIGEIPEKHEKMIAEFDRVIKMISEDEKINVNVDAIQVTDTSIDSNYPELEMEVFDKFCEDFSEAAYSLDEEKMKKIIEELSKYQLNGVVLVDQFSSINKKINNLDLFSASDALLKVKEKIFAMGGMNDER